MTPDKGILVVDDDYFVRQALKLSVVECGFARSWAVASGEDACDMVRLHRPDAILMDYNLRSVSGRTGLDYAREILEQHPCQIVFLTGMDDPDIYSRMRDIGAAGILTKPILPTQLHHMLTNLPD